MIEAYPSVPQWGLQLLDSGTASNAATLDFNFAAHPGFRGFRMELTDFLPVTDNVGIYARVSTNGGSSFDEGSSDYMYHGDQTYSAGGGGSSARNGNGNAQILLTQSIDNALAFNMSITMMDVTNTGAWPKLIAEGAGVYNSGTDLWGIRMFGARAAAQDTDQLRVLAASGNLYCDWALYGFR